MRKQAKRANFRAGVQYPLNEDDWRIIYSLPFMFCRDVKMQMFQYKINMRCLMTNDRLYRMNIVNDNLCSLCKHDVKTMKHLLLNVSK